MLEAREEVRESAGVFYWMLSYMEASKKPPLSEEIHWAYGAVKGNYFTSVPITTPNIARFCFYMAAFNGGMCMALQNLQIASYTLLVATHSCYLWRRYNITTSITKTPSHFPAS